MKELKVSSRVAAEDPAVSVIDVEGSLDNPLVPVFEEALTQLESSGRVKVIVNLKKMDYMASGGFSCLLNHLKKIRNKDGDIILSCPTTDLDKVIDLLQLPTIMQVYKKEKDAVNAFA